MANCNLCWLLAIDDADPILTNLSFKSCITAADLQIEKKSKANISLLGGDSQTD